MKTSNSHLASLIALSLIPLEIAGATPFAAPLQKEAPEKPTKAPKKPLMATPFELPTIAGATWRMEDHRGDVLVMEWIDPECPMVTRQHSPEGTIRLAANQTEAMADVSWVAINSSFKGLTQGSVAATKAARERLLIEHPVVMDGSGWVGRAYGVEKSTHVVVIDKKGRIVYSGAPDDGRGGRILTVAIAAALAGEPYEGEQPPAYGCGVRYATGITLGSAVPPMNFSLVGARAKALSAYRGSPLVLEWFDHTDDACVSAHEEGGALAKAMDRARKQGAAWMLIDGCPVADVHSSKAVSKKAKELGIGAPVASDVGLALRKAFGPERGAEIMILDERGVLVFKGSAAGGENSGLMKALRSLDEPAPGTKKVGTRPSDD